MNDYQIAQVDMIDVTNNVLTLNNSVWSSNTVFSALVTEFRALRTRIGVLAMISVRDDTGITIDKNDSRLLLIQKAMRIGRAIQIFAQVSGNDQLIRSVSKTESELMALQDLLLIAEMQNYAALATTNATALEDYDILAADITAFNTEITNFTGWKPDPYTATIQRKSANDTLDLVIQETVDFLTNRIDPAMYLFEGGTDLFYTDYFNARTLVDPQSATMALRGSVQDSVTHLPLAGVNVDITDSSITRVTGETGVFQVISLAQGTHNINLSRVGYQTLAYTVNIVTGQTTEIVILMVAQPIE